jgi:hypothetical protein
MHRREARRALAQATADVVDPYHVGALGDSATTTAATRRKHEISASRSTSAPTRASRSISATVQVGAEAGVLFPGHAFDDALGVSLPNQYLGNFKLGLQF